MTIDDEVRNALRHRADAESVSADEAWDRLNTPKQGSSVGKRVTAGLVAFVVFAAAFVVVTRVFSPDSTTSQRASTTYGSATSLAAALHDAGLGCDRLGVIFGILQPGVDVRSCQVNGEDVWLWVYQKPEALKRFESEPSATAAPAGVFNVRGENWLVATKSLSTAQSVQSAIGGSLEGLASPSPTASVGTITVTKGGTLDVAALGGLTAAEEAYGSLWLGVITDTGTEIVRADPQSGGTEHRFPVPGWSPSEWGGSGIVIGGGMVWVPGRENGQATITRIDPATNGTDLLKPAADAIAYLTFGSDGTLWANVRRDDASAIAQIDPGTGQIIQTWSYTAEWAREICDVQGSVWVHEMSVSNSNVGGGWLSQVVPGIAPQVDTGGTFAGPACGTDAVWTAINGDDKVVNLAHGIAEVDPATGLVTRSWSTPPIGYDMALDADGGVWFLTASSHGEVERLDPSTGAIDAKVAVSGTPIFISTSTDHIWVGTYEGRLYRFDLSMAHQ